MPDSSMNNYDNNSEGGNMTELMVEDFAEAISHGMVVSELAVLLSRELGHDDEFCRVMAVAGMLHDIGKLKLGDFLHLKRSEAMVVEKLKVVRLHSRYSRDILKSMGYSDEIQDIVYHHHENYDGTGYPDNIAGNDIPEGARILRVCDVYAALISDRSYRKAFTEKVAVELMIEEAMHFDVKVFLAFLNVIHYDGYEKVRRLTGQRIDASAEAYLREYFSQNELHI